MYLLTAFIQLFLPPTPNLWYPQIWLFFLWVCMFVCFWNITDLQYYVSSYYTMQWFFCKHQNDHHDKPSYDMLQYKDIT